MPLAAGNAFVLHQRLRELVLGSETGARGTSSTSTAQIALNVFPSLETKLQRFQYDARVLNPNVLSRPCKMYLGLVGGFESSITASGVEPGALAKLEQL